MIPSRSSTSPRCARPPHDAVAIDHAQRGDVLERDGIIAHRPGDGAVGVAGHSAAVGAERERGGEKVGLAYRLLTRRLAHRLVGAAPQHSDAEQRYDERGKSEAPEEF